MIKNNKKTTIKSETNVHVTEKYKYKCDYCSKKYKPKRRRTQKYFSGSCRSKAYRARQLTQPETQPLVAPTNTHIKKISPAGIGDAFVGATLGNLAIDWGKSAFTSEENKTATKSDLKNLERLIGKYHEIKAIPRMPKETIPYYNMETKEVEFFMKEFLPTR